MKTKNEVIGELKAQHPNLKDGSEEVGYRELNENEYNDTIEKWADWIIEEEKLQAAANELLAKKEQAEAKLAALGLTADDLKALGLA